MEYVESLVYNPHVVHRGVITAAKVPEAGWTRVLPHAHHLPDQKWIVRQEHGNNIYGIITRYTPLHFTPRARERIQNGQRIARHEVSQVSNTTRIGFDRHVPNEDDIQAAYAENTQELVDEMQEQPGQVIDALGSIGKVAHLLQRLQRDEGYAATPYEQLEMRIHGDVRLTDHPNTVMELIDEYTQGDTPQSTFEQQLSTYKTGLAGI